MIEKIESVNKYGKFWIDEHEIFNFKYHPGAVIELEAAQFLVKERIKLYNGNRYVFLLDLRGLKYMSNPAYKYFSSDDSTILIPAGAFLVGTLFSKIIGRCFLKVYPPNPPTKMFLNKDEATKWLLQYQ